MNTSTPCGIVGTRWLRALFCNEGLFPVWATVIVRGSARLRRRSADQNAATPSAWNGRLAMPPANERVAGVGPIALIGYSATRSIMWFTT